MLQTEAKSGSCVALGNFDGIHLGHREIIERCAKTAKRLGLVSLVWSFRRHPEQIMKDFSASGNILSLSDKEEWIRKLGIDHLILEDFERVRNLSPEAFCEKVLIGQLQVKEVFCGFNFRFGKSGSGDAAFLTRYLSSRGVRVTVVDPVCIDGEPVSSTRIRALLSEGDMQGVMRLLGRPYSIRFPVLHGKRLGTRIGFPTLNQAYPEEYVVPQKGVYAVRMNWEGQCFPGVCNVGSRPTVDRDDLILAETHLFDFSGDLYGKKVQIEFFQFLRPETRFSSVEELTAQIQTDRERASAWWKENS